jgi:hypothetical protein
MFVITSNHQDAGQVQLQQHQCCSGTGACHMHQPGAITEALLRCSVQQLQHCYKRMRQLQLKRLGVTPGVASTAEQPFNGVPTSKQCVAKVDQVVPVRLV